jgi:ABC-type branched-subunit amino acid transport system substrate-binding protein
MTRRNPICVAALVLALCLSLPADAAKRRTPDVVEDALAFALTDRDKAVLLLEGAIADGVSPKDLDPVTVHAGEQRRLEGELDLAHRWFTTLLQRNDIGPDADSARLGLALIDASTSVSARTLTMMAAVTDKNALATQNADRYLILALKAAQSGDTGKTGSYTRKALVFAKEDPAVFARVSQALDGLAKGEATPPATGLPTTEGDADPLVRADAALEAGKKDEARALANSVLEVHPDPTSPQHRAAAYMLRRIDAPPVVPGRITVLLPMSGRYEAVGRQVKEALVFGFRAGGGRENLVFTDTGATAESAVLALEEAVLNQGSIAVIGPLLSDETEPVVAAAEALHIPLISLSQSLEDLDGKSWTLQGMVTRGDQVRALVDHVMGEEGMDAFAIFAPQSAYGENAALAFEEAVKERGGRVTVKEMYTADATDLLPFAKALGRKDYDARSAEFYRLRVETKERGGDPARTVLPPVLDFDALFLPENFANVPLAVAALAYEEFPMGHFLPSKESPKIPLLGLSGWNNTKLVTNGGPYVRDGIFVDAFAVPHGEDPSWQLNEAAAAFVVDYRAEMRRTPSALEVMTTDVGRLVAGATAARPSTRTAFRDALLAADVAGTMTGATGFDNETRRANRTLLLLSVTEDDIMPLNVARQLAAQEEAKR